MKNLKLYTSIIVMLYAIPSLAQRGVLNEVIEAEKSFAQYSVDHGTRDAFVEYMAPNGVLFSKNEPVNGKQLWSARPSDKVSLLFWWPQYADVSVDGTLGYTTGPWYAKPDRNVNEKKAFGYYTSVWEKQTNGTWRVVLDISIPLPNGLVSEDTAVASPTSSLKKNIKSPKQSASVSVIDSLYNNELSFSSKTFLAARFAADSRIHRSGQWPHTSQLQFGGISENVSKIRFKQHSKQVREAGDLSYTYGTALVAEGDKAEKPFKYLRIWKLIDGEWKIVVDILS